MPPSDNGFGSRREDGTWNGMVGLVITGEADLGLGPLAITEPRWRVVAYSKPVFNTDLVILTSKGSLEIDPWAFLLPLTPALWGLLMVTLVVVWVATLLVGRVAQAWQQWPHSIFLQLYGALMQQGVTMPLSGQRLRLVVGGWVVASALVVWSYSGLLVSVMTVRHVPRPIQTVKDLIDASHIKVFTRSKTAFTDLMAVSSIGVSFLP
ncbi:glutamate receptor ionotropic, delta-2-like [Portunus trituberculatus]|uniref:glutamate receptor ionotropic, delta-2-like n=1 Tax=Portunus trituberculatus TaxID=210409 RepID=UPI001E1CB181|nr:glutamate receptor ionotropic, delta-2-like [Portunus trituberculatus]